jgi:cell wall-associated NlpC family hydrolase
MDLTEMDKRQTAIMIAWSFLGRPYIWGGDDPVKGFDCSGFVIECLKSVGVLPRAGDWTAQGLKDYFKDNIVTTPGPGRLAFWQNRDKSRIIHVEMCIDKELCIGASGGGSKTLTSEDAIKQNAYIKIRPFKSRSRLWGFVDPFKEEK